MNTVESMDPAYSEDLEMIVSRARAGDETALGQLFERFYDGVHRYALLRTGNRADADDAAAEVFAQMVRSISKYVERGPGFAAWIYRIARNVVADHHRRASRRHEEPIAELPDHPGESLEDTVTTREAAQELRGQLASLPDEQAHLLVLRFAGGLSAEEIGSVLGKSAGAVRIQQMRALESLRKRMEAVS